MVRLTRAGEYAIRGMLYLAQQPADGLTLIADVARSQGVSAGFLAKIFQELARAGLVDSYRGAGGGVSLGKRADAINLRMIIEAVEGPVALNNCLAQDERCANVGSCCLAETWRQAQEAMLTVLERKNLGELAAEQRAKSGVNNREDVLTGVRYAGGNGMGS